MKLKDNKLQTVEQFKEFGFTCKTKYTYFLRYALKLCIGITGF